MDAAAVETRLRSCGVIPVIGLSYPSPVNRRAHLTNLIELTLCDNRVGNKSGMIDGMIPSLLRLGKRRVSGVMNGSARLTFRQLLGRALGCYCLRSNGLQPHCQQYHLTIIANELLPLVHSMEWAACLQRRYNRRRVLGVGKPGHKSLRRFA